MRNGGSILSASFIFLEYPKEVGYDFLNVLIAYLTANRYIFILIVTVIIYSLTFISFKRYMTNYPFAVVLFLALMFFFHVYLSSSDFSCKYWMVIYQIYYRSKILEILISYSHSMLIS
jgi:hypothetical protein